MKEEMHENHGGGSLSPVESVMKPAQETIEHAIRWGVFQQGSLADVPLGLKQMPFPKSTRMWGMSKSIENTRVLIDRTSVVHFETTRYNCSQTSHLAHQKLSRDTPRN